MDSLKQRTKNAGELMRFITPVLVSIAIYMLSDLRGRVDTLTNATSNLVPRVAVLESKVDRLEARR